MQIYNCIKTVDQKQWPAVMQEMYEDFVMDHEIKQKPQDP